MRRGMLFVTTSSTLSRVASIRSIPFSRLPTRAASAFAARVGNLEETTTRITKEADSLAHSVVLAVKDLGKQIQEVKQAVESRVMGR